MNWKKKIRMKIQRILNKRMKTKMSNMNKPKQINRKNDHENV